MVVIILEVTNQKKYIEYNFPLWSIMCVLFPCYRLVKERVTSLRESGCNLLFEEAPFSLSIVTVLMQRVLNHVMSQKISLFIDSSASCDQANTSLTIILASSKAGALPVGVSLHDSQSEESYTHIFNQLKSLWPESLKA